MFRRASAIYSGSELDRNCELLEIRWIQTPVEETSSLVGRECGWCGSRIHEWNQPMLKRLPIEMESMTEWKDRDETGQVLAWT